MFYHAGDKDRVIGALIHRNLLHLIPVKTENNQYKLSDPVTVMIGESDIEDLTALNSGYTREKLSFVCIEHHPRSVTTEYCLNIYEIESKDTIAQSNELSPFDRDLTEKFSKKQLDHVVSKVVSMPFGGFLAFSSTRVMYFADSESSSPASTQGFFKEISRVKSTSFIDTLHNPYTYESPTKMFRMVFITETGQFYLLMFKMQAILNGDMFDLMNLSFQGKLQDINVMVMLNSIPDGFNFLGGTLSGYNIFEITKTHTTDEESPYLRLLHNHEE